MSHTDPTATGEQPDRSSAYWIARSVVLTFLTVFIGAVPIEAVAAGDFSWWRVAALSAVAAAFRVLVNVLDSSFPLYGRGSGGSSGGGA